MKWRLLLVFGAALTTGCASTSKPMYAWGGYEELIYTSYAAPGSAPPEMQIERMERDYQVALAADKRVPPGWHAHLGYLYYQVGKREQAMQELRTEKAEYPEATVFVERLLANIR